MDLPYRPHTQAKSFCSRLSCPEALQQQANTDDDEAGSSLTASRGPGCSSSLLISWMGGTCRAEKRQCAHNVRALRAPRYSQRYTPMATAYTNIDRIHHCPRPVRFVRGGNRSPGSRPLTGRNMSSATPCR